MVSNYVLYLGRDAGMLLQHQLAVHISARLLFQRKPEDSHSTATLCQSIIELLYEHQSSDLESGHAERNGDKFWVKSQREWRSSFFKRSVALQQTTISNRYPESMELSEMAQGQRTVSSLMEEAYGPPKGYPQVATFMGNHPEMAMFRRFGSLNARNILYLQAELMQIEKKLLECEKVDAAIPSDVDIDRCRYSLDYEAILNSRDEDGKNDQYKLIQEMKVKLKEYNEVLIQQCTLASVAPPSKYDRDTMQNWYSWTAYAGMPLEGVDAYVWAHPKRVKDGKDVSEYANDLIAINGQSDDIDRISKWLGENFIPNWNQKVMRRLRHSVLVYKESTLYGFTSVIATMLSSLLPIVSIVVLYLVHSTPARLGIIAGFTALFSVAISLVTSASRVDNFAATAAFAAVQVVFVGTSATSNGTSGP